MIRTTMFAALAALALGACGGSQKTSDEALLSAVQTHHEYDAIDVDNQPISILEKRHLSVAFATYSCSEEPIYFPANSATLLPQAREQVKLLSWCVRDYRANDIVVAPRPGSADTEASAGLDQARADAVRAYLQDLGVDTSALRIRTAGQGVAEGTLILPSQPEPTQASTKAKAAP